jgi:pimeloyl-ACP methyl ester carboxylesterase
MIQEHATAGKFKVLAIWGGKDDIVDTQKVSSRLMRTVPAAKLVIVDGIGHNIGTAAPVEVADHVHSFIEGKEDA